MRNKKVMSFENKRGQNKENLRKIEKALMYKWLKMEKNWKRSAKVFGHRQAMGDGPVYSIYI